MAEFIDLSDLRAFAVVAAELNMRRAAEMLHISQPPLSRKIKNLESTLGIMLFIRHSHGLELTPSGQEVLQIITPLLEMQNKAQKKLASLGRKPAPAIGLTTAFEQEIFTPILDLIRSLFAGKASIRRATSPKLARDVAKRQLLTALVALPMRNTGLTLMELPYSEKLMACVPASWVLGTSTIDLQTLNGRPFFWPAASLNPSWHQWLTGVFKQLGFMPQFIDEPREHDVLLSRIASGEAFALMPSSFAAIQRRGIQFLPVTGLPALGLGIIFNTVEGEELARKIYSLFTDLGHNF